MTKQEHISTFTRVMALICNICPLCFLSRLWPQSRLARWCESIRERCLFCKAYNKVKHVQIKAEESPAEWRIPVSHIRNVA